MKKIMLCAALLLGAALGRADTSTPRMGIVKPTIGSTGWGQKWNDNANVIDTKAACLLCVNTFTQANTFQGVTTFSGGAVFSSTVSYANTLLVGTTFYTPGVSEVSDLIYLRGSQPFFLMENEGGSAKKMGFRADADGSLTLWNETDGLTIATFDDGGESFFNSIQVTNSLTFQGTPIISNATNDPLTIASIPPVNFDGGRVGFSGTSASAEITATSTGPFAGLVGEEFIVGYNGDQVNRFFRDEVAFTIDSVDSGTELTISGDTTGLHVGATIRQGPDVTTVTNFDPNTPTALEVDDTTGFSAAAAEWSDFLDPDAATVDEVVAALNDPSTFWPGMVSFSNSGGYVSVSAGFNGSLRMPAAGETVDDILGFTVGDTAPDLSITHKNDPLTGFLFADDGGPGPWGVWAFSDSRRWLQVDSLTTHLYGNLSLGDEEFPNSPTTVTVQNRLDVGGDLFVGGGVGPLTVGNSFGNGIVNIVNDSGTQHVRFFSGGGSGGSGEINNAAGSTTISFSGDAGSVTADGMVQGSTVTGAALVDSPVGGYQFPDDSIQTTAANLTVAARFASTQTVSVSNTVSTSTLLGAGVGSLTLPSNFWTVGKTVRVHIRGFYSTDATTPGTINFLLKHGAVTISSTTVFDMTTTSWIDADNSPWEATFDITCRSTGGSGSVVTTGMFYIPNVSPSFGAGTTAGLGILSLSPVTIDTTASAAIDFQVHWGTADSDNEIHQVTATLESLAP